MSAHSTALSESRIIIPVRNGGARWREAAVALSNAIPDASLVAVIDSSSTDGSAKVAADLGFAVENIDPRHFNHGGTRQMAVDRFCAGRQFAIFLTHDAVIQGPASLADLLDAFSNPQVGAAYGRQLPHHDANPFGRHSASFLYPGDSSVRSLTDAPRFGIRTTHISNSFAAYRIQALSGCGGFPTMFILGEDVHVAYRLMLAGWSVSYRAGALVRHSHNYSILQEMQRYFDYGVFHAQLPQLLHDLGEPAGDGVSFVASELKYVARAAPWLLPEVGVRNAGKYLGYRLGRMFDKLPPAMRRRLSMTKGFWDEPGR